MKIKYIFPLLLVLFAFACKNELTIFEQINEETKLEDAEIKGSVNSIVKFKDKLYATDGNIYSKNIDVVRGWGATAGPGGNIHKLTSNGTNLYALNEHGELFTTTDGSAWNKVDVSVTISSIETIFDNRLDAAYIHGTAKDASETSYFKLEGTTASPTDEVSSIVVLKTDKGTYTAKDGTVMGKPLTAGFSTDALGSVSDLGEVNLLYYTDNAIYVFTNAGGYKLPLDSTGKLSTKEDLPKVTEITTSKGTYTAKDGTVTGSNDLGSVSGLGKVNLLYHTDNTIYVFTNAGGYKLPLDPATGNLSTKEDLPKVTEINTGKGIYTAKAGTVTGSNDLGSVSISEIVHSLTYSVEDEAVYAGTSKGLRKLPVGDAGKLTGENLAPPGNSNATIKSYEAFAVLATGTKPNDSALYTSTISSGSDYSKINGLWGYYYSRRDNWNRE